MGTATDATTDTCAPATPAMTKNKDGMVTTCTKTCGAGSWSMKNTCTKCVTVTNALTATCTSAKDSKAATCKAGMYADTTCKACTAIVGSTGADTCTAAPAVTAGSTLNTVSTFGAAIVGVAAAA